MANDYYTPSGGQTIFPRVNLLKTFSARFAQRVANGRIFGASGSTPSPTPDPLEIASGQGANWLGTNVYEVGEVLEGRTAAYTGGVEPVTYRYRFQFKPTGETVWVSEPWSNTTNAKNPVYYTPSETGQIKLQSQARDGSDPVIQLNSTTGTKTVEAATTPPITTTIGSLSFTLDGASFDPATTFDAETNTAYTVVASISGDAVPTYNWSVSSGSATLTSSGNTATYTPSADGSSVLSLSVTGPDAADSPQTQDLNFSATTTPTTTSSVSFTVDGNSVDTAFNARSTGTVLYDINWGDGNTQTAQTSNTLLHTYSSPGVYTVTITTASTYAIYYNNVTDDARQITSVSWGGSDFPLGTSLDKAWQGSQNMTSFGLVDTSSVEVFVNTWRGCTNLASFPPIDTSSATTLSATWRACTSLTSFPLIDTSSVTNMNTTWYGCDNLTSFPLIDTSSVDGLNSTWRGCSGLTSFPLIDTSSVTAMGSTWMGCNGLTSFPLIDTSSVTVMSSSWESCLGLLNFPLIDTGLVTNIKNAWQACVQLVSFPAISCASATQLQSAWLGCTSLTTFPANMFDTTGTLVSAAFNNTFKNCALTAQSIENILTSLDTNGQSGIALTLSGGTNAAKTTWSTAAVTAYDNLILKGWTITFNA